jgi:hypothetical protein
MTPKEKAYDLVILFIDKHNNVRKDLAKKFALIAVDAIIKSREDDSGFDDTLSSTGGEYYKPHPMYLTYWLQVKQEIEKL